MDPDDPTRKHLEYFEMAVYCFPKPEEEDQCLMIRTVGFTENVARDIKYEERTMSNSQTFGGRH